MITSETHLDHIPNVVQLRFQQKIVKLQLRFSVICNFMPYETFIPFSYEDKKCAVCSQTFKNTDKLTTNQQNLHYKTERHQSSLKKRKLLDTICAPPNKK
eukprot:UN26762